MKRRERRFWRENAQRDGRRILREPNDPAAWCFRAVSRLRLGQAEAALRDLDRSHSLDPTNPTTYFERGNALFDLKRYEEAVEGYSRALDLGFGDEVASCPSSLRDRTRAVAFYNRALVRRELNEREESLEDYGAALSLHPSYADALNNRGVLLNALEWHGEALSDLDRGVAVAPKDPLTYANQANALLRLDRPKEALRACDRALALDPRCGIALYNKACALARLRRLDEADYWLRRSIQRSAGHAADARNDPDLSRLGEKKIVSRRVRLQ